MCIDVRASVRACERVNVCVNTVCGAELRVLYIYKYIYTKVSHWRELQPALFANLLRACDCVRRLFVNN